MDLPGLTMMKKQLKTQMRFALRHSFVHIQARMLSLRGYKKLVKSKVGGGESHAASNWSGHELSARSHNSAVFWHSVAGILKEWRFIFNTPITVEDWENYYHHLFALWNLLRKSY